MRTAYALDPEQGLSESQAADLARVAADLGYDSAWMPAHGDVEAFDRCLRWHDASGLPVGIAVVPASAARPAFYAQHARRVWEGTGGRFVLGVGSGALAHPVAAMRDYLAELRDLLPGALPVYLAALGPRMLALGGELADGVALNWCTPDAVEWSRGRVAEAAGAAGRPVPQVAEYIRTCVDPDGALARARLGDAALRYVLGPPGYRRHFERLGFAGELRALEGSRGPLPDALVAAIGAAGPPGAVREQVAALADGLDLAIVRVIVATRGDGESARRVLEECAPRR